MKRGTLFILVAVVVGLMAGLAAAQYSPPASVWICAPGQQCSTQNYQATQTGVGLDAIVINNGTCIDSNTTPGSAQLCIDGGFWTSELPIRYGNVDGGGGPFFAPVIVANDAGNAGNEPAFQWGSLALSSGSGTVTFNPAFSAVPICVCSDTASSAAAADCNGATALALTLKGTGTDTVNWVCIGNR